MLEETSEEFPQEVPRERSRIRIRSTEAIVYRQMEMPEERLHFIGEPKANISPMFFHDRVFSEVYSYLKSDTSRERGALLIGQYCITPDDQRFVEVTGFTPVTRGLPATGIEINISQDDIVQAVQIIDQRKRNESNESIVGWTHSHPGMRPAPSEKDIFIMRNFFSFAPEQFTLIVDPIQRVCGFFRFQDGVPVNQGGFAILGEPDAILFSEALTITPHHTFTEIHQVMPPPVEQTAKPVETQETPIRVTLQRRPSMKVTVAQRRPIHIRVIPLSFRQRVEAALIISWRWFKSIW